MNTFRNIALALCVGSIVAIIANVKISHDYRFSSTALALGFFAFSTVFLVKPIRVKERSK